MLKVAVDIDFQTNTRCQGMIYLHEAEPWNHTFVWLSNHHNANHQPEIKLELSASY